MKKVNIDLKNDLDVLVTTVISSQYAYNRYMTGGHRNEDFVNFQQTHKSQNELVEKISNSYSKIPTEPKGEIVTICENGIYDSNRGRYNKFIEFNGKRYKLLFDLRNGGRDVTAMVMNDNGEFKHLLCLNDLGNLYVGTSTYVSLPTEKERDAKKAIECLENLIKVIHK